MAKQWSKVYRNANQSERLSECWKLDEGAFGFYWMLKAWADDYAHYKAHPAKVAHEAGGLLLLSAERAAEMLAVQEQCGLITFYEVDGDQFLEIVDYHKHEVLNWQRVGKPEYPHPANWSPPESLVEFLTDHEGVNNITPERYGLTVAQCRRLAIAQQEQCARSAAAEQELNGTDVDVDVDKTEKENVVNEAAPPALAGNGAAAGEAWPGEETIDEEPTGYGSAGGVRTDTSMRKQNNPILSNACHLLPFRPDLKDRWFDTLLTAIGNPADWLISEDQVVTLMGQCPPATSEGPLPERWLERVEKLAGPQSDSSRSDALDEQERQIHEEWLKSQSEERAT